MEDHQQLSILNPEPLKLPGPELLHLLVGGADADTQTPALDYRAPDGTRVTLLYPDLHRIANVVAAEIGRRLQAVPDAPLASAPKELVVPVLIPQAPELYVSLLGILKAGGAFCPIQLDAPPDRIRFILGDVGAEVVLTTSAMVAKLPADIVETLHIVLVDELLLFDGQEILPAAETSSVAPRTPGPDDLAYVMYTSGSTGTPKGVGVPHGAATQSLLSHDRHMPQFARFLQFAAPTFDVSVFEIFFPWFRGATLVCCSRAEMLDDLPAVIRSLNVDACELTPTVAGSLLQSRANAPNLRLLLTIGEMLTEPVVREFGGGPEQTSMLWAMYGPTEAAIHCTLQPALGSAASVKNIGFPLDTVSAYILAIPDDAAEPSSQEASNDPRIVPLGEVGELAVGGYQLARGYINRPEQTAAAFIDTEKYGRLYRTGDKARITEQGILECSGRLSGGQVKLRGQRIELGEVEQAVLRTSGCLGSVAAVVNGNLVAFCDVGPKAFPDTAVNGMEEAVLASCQSWLPRFMIPGDVVLMADFPRLASGKVDRKRLASEYAESNARQEPAQKTAEFKDDLDRQLHDIAAQILGAAVYSTASLAAVGLDSLKAIQFAASIRASTRLQVGAVDVLETRSLATLHARLKTLALDVPDANTTAQNHILEASVALEASLRKEQLDLKDVELVTECNPIQAAMLAETLSDPRAYCNWIELEFAEHQPDAVASAFAKLIDHNEALRARFVQHEGRFVQLIRRTSFPSQIRRVAQLQRDFQLAAEASLLVPFVVEIEDQGQIRPTRPTRAVLHIHHAVYDGWSADLMRRDLDALLKGETMALRQPYSAVVQHYRAMSDKQKSAAEQFWAETLNAFQPSPVPELNPRRDSTGKVVTKLQTLSIAQDTIDRAAAVVGCSAQAIFQAALVWLWSGLVGSADVVLGTVTSGRTLPLDGIETVFGPCLQTLPLRTDLSCMQTVRDLLQSLHASNRHLLPHAFLPLSDIKKTAGIQPGQPLYDVLFVYQESLFSQTRPGDVVAEVAHQDYLETKLLWEVEPASAPEEKGSGQFRVRTTFFSDTFPEAQVDLLVEQFASVVEHVVGHIDEPISSVLTSIPSVLQSLHNLDYRPFNGCPDLATLVQDTARQYPDRPAVRFATSIRDGDDGDDGTIVYSSLSFTELNQLANRIARCLRNSLGVKTGDAVAIIMDKSVMLYAGILGILRAGCAYLPLLPSTPLARTQTILQQAGVKLVLSDTAAQSGLLFSEGGWVVFDLQKTDLDAFPNHEFDQTEAIPADPTRVANIVYTSGSTGVPKGVCVTQLNICSNLDVLSRIYPVLSPDASDDDDSNGRLLQSCSQAFDVSVFEIFFSWVYGLCVCSATNDILFADLERIIRLFGITHLSMTPTVAALIHPDNTPTVKFLVTAGEPLTERVATAWSRQLFQGYGPSETTNICTVKKMSHGDTIRHLGFAFENTSTVVLPIDGVDFTPLPLGAVGEFCFGGDQVVAGYLGLPSLTAEKFIQHPRHGRLYRSGDVGRMLPDGSLLITGRIDDQIKLRGQRIELNEINAVLGASPQVSEARTLVVRQEGVDQLASFFVPASAQTTSFAVLEADTELTRALFGYLQSRLPVYMVPTFLVPIAAVPLTPSGKVNKALLLETFQHFSQEQLSAFASSSASANVDNSASEWTDVERHVCDAVANVLRADVKSIGRWTPLASLGLDSLSAILVARRLSTADTRLLISDVLRNASVAQLAQLIEDKTADKESVELDHTPSASSLDVFSPAFMSWLEKSLSDNGLSSTTPALPCMPLQEAMLVSPTRGKSYVNSMLFRLTGDVSAVQAAWREMCARHDILRTCFVTTDHATYPIAQVVLDNYTAPWLDLTASTKDDIKHLIERHAQSLPNPVDSFQPPVSFAVIRHDLAAYLSFVCHHAVYDGEAMGRLLWEVEQLVVASSEHRPHALDAAPAFRAFLKQALDLPASTDVFWHDHLSGFKPTLLLPTSSSTETTAGIVTTSLDTPLAAIQDQTQTLGVSLLTAFQATWACVTGILLQSDDVCFGNIYSGRSVLVNDVDRLVAPCFNTLPVRADLSTIRSNRDLLSYFQALNPDMLLHQFTPLRQIQRKHSGGRRLFDTLLLLQPPTKPLDATVWSLEQDDGEMDLPIVCELVPDSTKNDIQLRLHFDRQTVNLEGATLIVDLFSSILKALLQFSSSHIPGRVDLAQSLQVRLGQLQLDLEQVSEDNTEEDGVNVDGADETWGPTEQTIRAVLSQLSSVPATSIRRDTTIYRLGLDSVRAVQVASALRKQGLLVSAVDVMEHPSCAGLAAFLSRPEPALDAAANTVSNISEILTPETTLIYTPLSSPPSVSQPASHEPKSFDFVTFQDAAQSVLDKHRFYADGDVEAILPCTPLQTGLLTEFKRSNGAHYFNFISFDWTTRRNRDGQEWADAWTDAAKAIPMLRTGFINMDDAVDSGDDDDVSALSPFAMVQVASTVLEKSPHVAYVPDNAVPAFNFAQWKAEATASTLAGLHRPPWQVSIVQDGERLVCHLAIHHALFDAASLRTMLGTVADFANGQGKMRDTAPQTGAVVSDILHQVSWATCDTSTLIGLWKDKAPQTVVNMFPVLTPLKETNHVAVLSRPSSQTLATLQALVQAAGFTLNAVLQAAWTRILSSYVGDAPVVFGVVLSGRNTDATESAIFPCISTLPVVAQNAPSNRALVEQMMDTSILLHKSQHVPLRQVQRWLGQPDARLFDTLLVYQSSDGEDSYPWSVVDEQAIVDYPVSIEAITAASDQPLAYQITFDTAVLPAEHAFVLLEQLEAIVGHLASCPDGSEDDLVTLRPDLYSVLPPSVFELPSDVKLLHEFVERQLGQRPTKTALQFVTGFDESAGGVPISEEWTFQELNARGNQVAHLVGEHARPGSIVAVCFDKCPEAFFAILGILKAGCAYLALDPGAPSARKDFILQDAGAKLLLTDKTRAKEPVSNDGLSDISEGIQAVAIDESSLRANANSATSLAVVTDRPTNPSDVCYCLYTSGTTGTPKGCTITHENAVQCMLAFQELFRDHYDADTSRWLQFASFHFDVAVLEQYWTWSVGMTLVGAPRDLILEDLAGTISRLEITHIDLTPSLGRLLNPRDVPSLCRGVFITGGEPLKQEMLDPWGPTGAVHNFYGPTEATIGVTSFPQVPQNGRASNIGRQFPNVGTLVFRPGTQTPILRGGVGELCVSGKLVGQGYLNRAELTNERFPELVGNASVYRSDHGPRIYRTGDLVRMLHDGCFDFLGRADDQVKLRGQRLEIGEINHAIRLGLGASIGDVATLVIRDEENKKDFLVSFVVGEATSDRADLARQVQAACRERLPGYMVPTYVVELASIPLSPNNKAEAKELKKIFNSLTPDERMRTTGAANNPGAAASTSAPTTLLSDRPTGRIVVEVLRRLSLLAEDDNSLTAHTSIFELSIDSISVLRFARALKRAGLSTASPSLILAHPKMGGLVEALHENTPQKSISIGTVLEARLLVDACQHHHRTQVCQALGVASDQIEYIAPCSALQQGIISRTRSGPEHTDTYFNAFHLQLASDTSLERLEEAWRTVVANNAILRTKFVSTSDGFVQVALKSDAVFLPWTQVNIDDDQKNHPVHQKCYREWVDGNQYVAIARPLQLLSVSWRGTRTLILHIFHGLYDAMSLDLVLQQVADAYSGKSSLAERPSFLDALVHGPLRNYASSRTFWADHLQGRGPLQPVPSLLAPGSPAGTEDVGVERVLSFAAIENLCVCLGVTHASLVQALWVSVLQKTIFGPSRQVALGLILSGRTMNDLDHADAVVGPLFNTLPFLAPSLGKGASWAALAQACNAFGIATLPFQQVPLRDVQKWCSAGKPLFDILFSFHLGHDAAAVSVSTNALWMQEEQAVQADYPLALEAVLAGLDGSSPSPSLKLFLVAKAGIADSEALNKVLDCFEAALQAMSADPFSVAFESDDIVTEEITANKEGVVDNTISNVDPAVLQIPPFEWTETATTLRNTIATIASVPAESIQVMTTLLELGLDSVDTIKLSARLRVAGIRLTNGQLVRGQTIAAFMEIVNADSDKNQGSVPKDTEHAAESEMASMSAALREHLVQSGHDLANVIHVLPPTPLQEAMVADMVQSGFQLYYNHDILALAPGVDIARLKAAWTAIIAKHAILRTVFFNIDTPDIDMSFCQAVKSSIDCITEHVVSNKDSLDKIVEDVRQTAIQGQGQSDLSRLSFVHALDDDSHYLILSISHALYDGWSLDLLHRAVEAEYNHPSLAASSEGNEEPAYINQLARILQSSGPLSDIFWKSFLDGASATHVQRQPSTAGHPKEKTVVRLESTSSVSAADLRAFCKQQAVGVQVVGQACWAAVLATLTNSLDLLFGVVLSGRDVEDDQAALFPTMNTVPVRVVLHGTSAELLQYMQMNMGKISEHQHYPLRKAQRAVPWTNRDEPGIFNTLFILQKRINKEGGAENKPLMESVGGASDVEYPICIEMEIVEADNANYATVVWRTACDQAYVTDHGAAQLLQQLDKALHFMLQANNSILSFNDNGVSVCGLAHFTPNMATKATDVGIQAVQQSPTDNDPSLWTPDELAIRAVLSAMSGVPESAIHRTGQTLYHLGLDSISTIKVSTMLRKTKGITLGVRALLAANSIEEMAESATRKETKTTTSDPEPQESVLPAILVGVHADDIVRAAGISPADIESVLPATAMQVHMVSVWQNTNGAVFFPAFRYRLTSKSDINLSTIHFTWSRLVAQHAILRTVFLATGSSTGVPLLQVTLRATATPAIDRDQTTHTWPALGDSKQTSFAVLSVDQEEDTFQVTLKIHHALYDAVSLQTLLGRFKTLLQSSSSATSSTASAWEQSLSRQFSPSTTQNNKQFWSTYFADAKLLSSTAAPPDISSRTQSRTAFYRPSALADVTPLKDMASSLGVGLQSLVFAVYAKTLVSQKIEDDNDVVFGVYLANRDDSDDSDDRGDLSAYPTLCLVPLLVRSPGRRTLADMAAQIQAGIHAMSSTPSLMTAAPLTASLWEIQQWTGVTVHSFVNFLLPEDNDEATAGASANITLEHISDASEVSGEQLSLAPSTLPHLQSNNVRGAYKDAIDVEMAVRNGSLDIGVFGSTAQLGDERGAESWVDKLVHDLLQGTETS